MPITPFIRRLESEFKFSDEEQLALRALPVREADIKADQEIVREGEQPTRVCFVISGMACSYKVVSAHKRQIFNFYLVGDAPDLLSLHLDLLDMTIATIVPSRIGFIHHDPVRAMCIKYPRIAAALWRHTLIEGAIFRAWMANIGQRTARSRIAHLYCEIFRRTEALGMVQKNSMEFPITQAEIGDALGLSYVHVNRVVQELRDDGLVVTKKGKMHILDWKRLQAEAEFEPDYLHLAKSAA
jgi:CRP-like cAMP-binding protein